MFFFVQVVSISPSKSERARIMEVFQLSGLGVRGCTAIFVGKLLKELPVMDAWNVIFKTSAIVSMAAAFSTIALTLFLKDSDHINEECPASPVRI